MIFGSDIGSPSSQAVSQTCADLPLAQPELDEECRRLRGLTLAPCVVLTRRFSMEFSSQIHTGAQLIMLRFCSDRGLQEKWAPESISTAHECLKSQVWNMNFLNNQSLAVEIVWTLQTWLGISERSHV